MNMQSLTSTEDLYVVWVNDRKTGWWPDSEMNKTAAFHHALDMELKGYEVRIFPRHRATPNDWLDE